MTRDDTLSSLALTETGIANQRVIDGAQWLANLHVVQEAHGIYSSDILATMALDNGTSVGSFSNFTVEMETGTGKTYVYLRTIHELSKTYGFKKFVIMVPSVAIREGVLSGLEITCEHFQTLYFVAETKKTSNGDHVQLDLLRPIEELRIECGKRHFKNFEQVQFRVVNSLEELVN